MSSVEVLRDLIHTARIHVNRNETLNNYQFDEIDLNAMKEALLALEKQEKKLNGDGGINNGWKSKLLGFSKRKKFS